MSVHAVAGLTGLNVLFLACGLGVVWLVRGLETWGEVARLAGLAYVVGTVCIASLWTLFLIAGGPFSGWVVVGLPVAVSAAMVAIARRLGRPRPRIGSPRAGPGTLVAAVGVAAATLLSEALLRGARLSGLYWWDAWAFWILKAKAIYFFGHLDEEIFRTAAGPSYPPLVPVLDAATFHAMGRPDVVTLHLQYWLLGIGFVWAVAGILSERRVPAWLLWPSLLLVLVAPRLGRRFLVTEADLLLDYLFVLAALLVLLWLLERERWAIVTATLLMCGMVLTKREGLLLSAVLVASALAVSLRDWRGTWPRLGLCVAAVAAVAAPWRIWYVAHGIEGEAPAGGVSPTNDVDRLWPAMRLAFDVLFSSDYWSVIVPVALGAAVLAALAREFRGAGFVALLVTLVTLGGGWFVWAIPQLPITQDFGGNPIVRYMGAAALLCAAATPLLLSAAWSSACAREKAHPT